MAQEQVVQSREPRESHEAFTGLAERLRQLCAPDVSPEEFLKELLRLESDFLGALYAAAWVPGDAAGEIVLASELAVAVGPPAVQLWRAPLRDLAAKALRDVGFQLQAVSEPADRLLSGSRYVAMGIPVSGAAAPIAALTVVVPEEKAMWKGRGAAGAQMIAGYGLLFVANRSSGAFKQYYENLSRVWDLIGSALAFSDPKSMAQVLANKARSAFAVKRVTVGFARHGKIKIVAVSEQDVFDKRSNLVRLLTAAQDETLAEEHAISVTPDVAENDQDASAPAHLELVRADEAQGSVFSVPLRADDEIVAVWTFEAEAGKTIDQDQQNLIHIASGQLGPSLALATSASQGVWAHSWSTVRAASRALFGSEHPVRRAVASLIGVVLLLLVFLPATLRISGRCVLEPNILRTYAAPFESILLDTFVLPDDHVTQGQPLFELDKEDIELELRQVTSELARVRKEADIYHTQTKLSEFAVSVAKIEGLEARLALLENRLSKATVTAAFKGIVLVGDLRQRKGSPVKTGDPLLQIAPLDKLNLLIELVEEDVSHVAVGQSGRFTLKAAPGRRVDFTVLKIRPNSENRHNQNVFVVEAEIPNPDNRLLPGMQGVAKINAGPAKLGWVLVRRLVNWVRMRLW